MGMPMNKNSMQQSQTRHAAAHKSYMFVNCISKFCICLGSFLKAIASHPVQLIESLVAEGILAE